MRKTADKIKLWMHKTPQRLITDEAYQLASLKYAPDMAGVIWEVKRAFEKGISPELSPHGSTSTFYLKDCEGIPIAVFKANRHIYEYAAYRLDYQGFAGVPQTVITTLEHPFFGKKTGACQAFVQDALAAVDLSRSCFSNFSSACIRKIAALDIRTMNEDRHTSNLLVINKQKIVPIDHGFILPNDFSDVRLAWVDWEQASTAFSEAELSYIDLLDAEADRRMLIDEMQIEEKLANYLFIATILLKLGAKRGIKPMELGKKLANRRKRGEREYSSFESLIFKIKEKKSPNWGVFVRTVYAETERLLEDA